MTASKARHDVSPTRLVTVFAVGALVLAACSPTDGTQTGAPQQREDSRVSEENGPTAAEREQATEVLLEAAAAGDIAVAEVAIAGGADLERRGDEDRTALVIATKAEHTELALLLLESGADPDAKDAIQDSAFLYSGAEGLDDILRSTLEHGADVSSTNRFDGTALIPAAEHGHVSTVSILIEAGVPLDHMNLLGWTALHEAILFGDGGADHLAVVRALLEAGADPALETGDGQSPRDIAVKRGQRAVVEELDLALP